MCKLADFFQYWKLISLILFFKFFLSHYLLRWGKFASHSCPKANSLTTFFFSFCRLPVSGCCWAGSSFIKEREATIAWAEIECVADDVGEQMFNIYLQQSLSFSLYAAVTELRMKTLYKREGEKCFYNIPSAIV